LHRSGKSQGNKFYQHSSIEPSFANKGSAALQNLQHSTQAKEPRLAEQSSMQSLHISTQAKEHERNAACSRKSREQLYFCCRRYPGGAAGLAELATRPAPTLLTELRYF